MKEIQRGESRFESVEDPVIRSLLERVDSHLDSLIAEGKAERGAGGRQLFRSAQAHKLLAPFFTSDMVPEPRAEANIRVFIDSDAPVREAIPILRDPKLHKTYGYYDKDRLEAVAVMYHVRQSYKELKYKGTRGTIIKKTQEALEGTSLQGLVKDPYIRNLDERKEVRKNLKEEKNGIKPENEEEITFSKERLQHIYNSIPLGLELPDANRLGLSGEEAQKLQVLLGVVYDYERGVEPKRRSEELNNSQMKQSLGKALQYLEKYPDKNIRNIAIAMLKASRKNS